ncbi:hypothetical protein M0R01_03865 [bacterium]|nr:hypothetical protein [bacterium]
MRKDFKTCLGNITTKPERKFQRTLSASYTKDKQDTVRGTIVASVGTKLYDVKLFKTDKILKNIPTTESSSNTYVVGTEVVLGYNKGNRGKINIIGVYPHQISSGSDNNFNTNNTRQKASDAFEATQKTNFVVYSEGDSDYLAPSSKVHSDLTGTELHDPKAHTHSGDSITPSNITSLNSERFNTISRDRSAYENENTIILYDTGSYKALCAYVNSSWQEIKRFA